MQKWTEERETRSTASVGYTEREREVEIDIELGGVAGPDVELTLTGRKLTVRYERTTEERRSTAAGELVETRRDRLTKEIEVPVAVDGSRADAVLENGRLRVTLARR